MSGSSRHQGIVIALAAALFGAAACSVEPRLAPQEPPETSAVFVETMDTIRRAVHTWGVLNEWYYSENQTYTTDRNELLSLDRGVPNDSVDVQIAMGPEGEWLEWTATHERTGPDAGCAIDWHSPREVRTPGGMLVTQPGQVTCDGDTPPSFRDEVATVIERYIRATDEGDTTTLREIIVDDGRFAWIERGEVPYTSVDDVLASLAMFPPDQPIETSLTDILVVPVGDRGARARTYFTTVIGPRTIVFSGWLDFILERGDDGWRILGGSSSTAN